MTKNAPVDNETNDPFDYKNAPGIQLIVLLRIYDLLAGIYSELDNEKAAGILDLHSKGKLFLPLPYIDIEENNKNH